MKTEAKRFCRDSGIVLKKVHHTLSNSDSTKADHRVFVKQTPRCHLQFAIDQSASQEAPLVEMIRDPLDSEQLHYVRYEGGKLTAILPHQTKSDIPPELRLPNRIMPHGGLRGLLADLSSTISQFVDLGEEELFLVLLDVLSSWFPDCVKSVPYLWLVGPMESGKTTLLKLLHCVCRRALLIGDVRPASLYKTSTAFGPTLLLDEQESDSSRMAAEVRRLLRIGNTPGVPAARNGQLFQTFSSKVISSRQPPLDAALASRAILIRMLPTQKNLLPLDENAMKIIASEFQPRLFMYRLQNHSSAKKYRIAFQKLQGLTPRIRDLAQGLAAPLLGDLLFEDQLVAILSEFDGEARIERFLEPEWLVVEALFRMCHTKRCASHILVGGVSLEINKLLAFRGENMRVTARGAGSVLRGLGLKTGRLGNLGRGLIFSSVLKEKIHLLARRFGFDRKDIATLTGLEAGYGGTPCDFCEKVRLTAGLRFAELRTRALGKPRGDKRRRPRLFSCADAKINAN